MRSQKKQLKFLDIRSHNSALARLSVRAQSAQLCTAPNRRSICPVDKPHPPLTSLSQLWATINSYAEVSEPSEYNKTFGTNRNCSHTNITLHIVHCFIHTTFRELVLYASSGKSHYTQGSKKMYSLFDSRYHWNKGTCSYNSCVVL
jgi:hypothetical protein